MTQATVGVKPIDLSQMRLPGAPTVSPDGTIAVVAVTRLEFAADSYTSQLWLVRTDGSAEPVQLTYGWHDSAPRISPDGRWLAFLRATKAAGSRAGGAKAEHDGAPQLCVMPLAGGEPRRLTDLPLGAGTPAWAPDSARLAFSARVPQEGRYGTGKTEDGETIGADGEAPRRITRYFYRVDGARVPAGPAGAPVRGRPRRHRDAGDRRRAQPRRPGLEPRRADPWRSSPDSTTRGATTWPPTCASCRPAAARSGR